MRGIENKLIVLLIILVSFFLGVTFGEAPHKNIWNEESDGLSLLNELMKDDFSERIAIVVKTKNNYYGISSPYLREGYNMDCSIFDDKGNVVDS